MKNGVYNKAIYWPDELKNMVSLAKWNRWILVPTEHYKDKAAILKLPDNCYKTAMYGEVVEAEYYYGLNKIITRVHNKYDRSKDMVFAISLSGVEARVKTVWLNDRADNHYTLHKSVYMSE